MAEYNSCGCIWKFNSRTSDSNQKWNNHNAIQCQCKSQNDCKCQKRTVSM